MNRSIKSTALTIISIGLMTITACATPALTNKKAALFREIQKMSSHDRSLFGNTGISPQIIKAMEAVPREKFVGADQQGVAYENRPLPIGYGQTISQPFIVAAMTDLLQPKASDKVLELGTGSGYQAAVLSPLVKHIYTMEIVPELADSAKKRLVGLGLRNITVKTGDGYHGWPDHAPYNKIIVTAAASHIPHHLTKQLAAGGSMIIPIGSTFATQHLMLVNKSQDNKIKIKQLMPVRFVPLVGKDGQH